MASQHRTLGILLASGLLLRLALFTGLSEQTLDTLGRQVELSTPLTNYRRRKYISNWNIIKCIQFRY
jgi:hypothetical protein